MSTQVIYAMGDDELVDTWSTADLVTKIEHGDAQAFAMVVRILAARLDLSASNVRQAREVLLDVSCSLASLTSAVEKVFRGAAPEVLDDTEGSEIATTCISQLDDASTGLRVIADGWI